MKWTIWTTYDRRQDMCEAVCQVCEEGKYNPLHADRCGACEAEADKWIAEIVSMSDEELDAYERQVQRYPDPFERA